MTSSSTVRRYLATTFGITWPAWWALAALGGLDDGPAPLLLVGGSGPLVAALAVRDGEQRREVLRSALRWGRLGSAWAPVLAVGVGPAVAGTVAAAATDELHGAGLTAALGALGFALLAGLGEEPGWRGTLLGPLIARHGLVGASLQVGTVWALWHLPLYFAAGTYQADRGLGWFAMSLVELPALSILLTWVHQRSGWLVAAPLLAHALGNAAGDVLPGRGTAADLTQTISILIAGAVVGGRLHRSRVRTLGE